MGYTLKENQIALVFEMEVEDNGAVTGDLGTSVVFPTESSLDDQSLGIMIDLITMLSVFLSYVEDKDELFDDLVKYRDEMLGLGESNVLSFNSKTMGSA
jgi:hypothetical protein